jgi:hypothetical protein
MSHGRTHRWPAKARLKQVWTQEELLRLRTSRGDFEAALAAAISEG